jgi:outer membrane receptor for ferrienterochelin and colicin
VSKSFLKEKLGISAGIRTDANTWSDRMMNPLPQLSPRISASYALTPKLNVNMNIGRFYQLPPYTALGYTGATGNYINRQNNLKYISSDHFVAGLEYLPAENLQITAEGFYKIYSDYPFSVRDSVPLSSKSADYGIFGDEELKSISDGRAYGVEILARLKEFKGTNVVLSYTFVRSEFKDYFGTYIPTAWDNRHLLNLTATKKLPRNWDIGVKFRFVGGAPYTPYDLQKSSLKAAWDIQGQGYFDFSLYNTQRLKSFHQLDIRVDKQYYFTGWSLMLYADVQNIYNHKADQPSLLLRETDSSGNPVTDPGDPSRYSLKFVDAEAGTVLPTIGVIIEF